MQKETYEKFENLMKKALNPKYSPKERAEAFDTLYYDYVKEKGSDKDWDKFREKLRKKYANFLTKRQKKKFGLTNKKIIICSGELKKFVLGKPKSSYPVGIFYKTACSLIKKLIKEGDKILDIGFGDFPTFVKFLNSQGYFAYGLEPFPKKFDKKHSFKGTIAKFPKKLEQKYDLILINMVYTINYTYHFPKKFKWELANKTKMIAKLNSLLADMGYLILIDDIGTIFSKKSLEKYFKVILFEKDNQGRITLLKKK